MIFKQNLLTRIIERVGISGNNVYEKSSLYNPLKTGQIKQSTYIHYDRKKKEKKWDLTHLGLARKNQD